MNIVTFHQNCVTFHQNLVVLISFLVIMHFGLEKLKPPDMEPPALSLPSRLFYSPAFVWTLLAFVMRLIYGPFFFKVMSATRVILITKKYET